MPKRGKVRLHAELNFTMDRHVPNSGARPMRIFKRSEDLLFDVYGTNTAGLPLSYQASIQVIERLGWIEGSCPKTIEPAVSALARRRQELRQEVTKAPLEAFQSAILLEAKKLADIPTALALRDCFSELSIAWSKSDPAALGLAAHVLLSFDPTHREAALRLTELLFEPTLPSLARTLVAGYLADSYRPHVDSEAMFLLREALARLLDGRDGIAWGPFAYSGMAAFLALDRVRTLELCEHDLRERAEDERTLLALQLSEASGADVTTLLLRRSAEDPSCRVRLRLLGVLKGLVPEKQRAAILSTSLHDDAPSWRWRAIKCLRLVGPTSALRLASAQLRTEPDAVLRTLLEEVVAIAAESDGRHWNFRPSIK